MHALDGANERVNGAREHLHTLKPLVTSFGQEIANSVSLDYKMGSITMGGRRRRVPIGKTSSLIAPAPARVSRLIGEVVQNLRSALEYLIYELACLDAKRIVEKTQFPVADGEEDFKGLLERYHLMVLTPEHVAAVKRLQPFDGCQWTKWLVTLSNPDKHQRLTVVKSPVVVRVDPRITKEILAGGHVDAQSYATVTVTFGEGTPVIKGLEQLILKVAQTLRDFHPEFKG